MPHDSRHFSPETSILDPSCLAPLLCATHRATRRKPASISPATVNSLPNGVPQVRMVLDTSGSWDHPANRKAVCRVYLRDLQREMGLTDAALQHVARVCGPRCVAVTRHHSSLCKQVAHSVDC